MRAFFASDIQRFFNITESAHRILNPLRFLLLLPIIQILSILAFLLAPCSSFAWTGKVLGIADGDTITVLNNGRGEKIRLHGIDTPEKGQAFGNKAKAVTGSMLRGRVVEITPMTTDRYGRTVALVYVDGQSLNEALVRRATHGFTESTARRFSVRIGWHLRMPPEIKRKACGAIPISFHRGNIAR